MRKGRRRAVRKDRKRVKPKLRPHSRSKRDKHKLTAHSRSRGVRDTPIS